MQRRVGGLLLVTLAPCLLASSCPQLDFGTLPSPDGDIGGASDYVGAVVCRGCHGEVHSAWSASGHAGALDALRDAGASSRSECLVCHVTGYRQGGFVSSALTPGFAGVQCESCHGTGARHVATRRAADIIGRPDTQACGQCHQQPEQPNFEEWSDSRHAMALQSVLDSPDRADACLRCHSTDYAAAVAENQARAAAGLAPRPAPTIEDDDPSNDPMESVGCASCHVAHGSEQPADLRVAVSPLCINCHEDEVVEPGRTPHAPQANLLASRGGREPSNEFNEVVREIPAAPGVHGSIESQGGCIKCHGLRQKVNEPTAENPNRTGHQFEVNFLNCTPCHSPEDAARITPDFKAEVDARVVAIQARIDEVPLDRVDGASRTRVSAAQLNLDLITADGSGGAHNAPYTREMLNAAEQLLDAVQIVVPP